MSRINGSILAPNELGNSGTHGFFSGLGLLVYAAAALVIVAALLIDPGSGYQAVKASWANDGTNLLLGLPLP